MPLVVIELIGGEASAPSTLARPLADALGAIFGSAPAQTWVRVRDLSLRSYAKNETTTPLGANAVFVEITRRTLPPPDVLATEAALVTKVVAQICARPAEHVHVIYQPPGAGRIAFGGELAT